VISYQSQAVSVDRSLAALADSTRRAICQRLAHGRATAGQLAALFPISRPAVSQHLRILKEAKLIRPAGDNRLSAYELSPTPLLELEAWLSGLVGVWQGAPLPSSTRSTPSAPTGSGAPSAAVRPARRPPAGRKRP